VTDGHIRNEIRAMFDEELVKIFEFIDMQLLRAGRLKLNVVSVLPLH
jgi:hypothetical protein